MISREKEYLLFPTERDLRLDLFRGIGQWMVFLDHIPFDVVNWLTFRNYGFSDVAELFVFISGYTAGFVYGPAVREGRIFAATARLLKRVWQLYVAHVFLFLFFIAYIAQTAEHYDNPMLAHEFNIRCEGPQLPNSDEAQLRTLAETMDAIAKTAGEG